MLWFIVKGEYGETLGYSYGNDHEEAFFNFKNGSLLLSDTWAKFEEISAEEFPFSEIYA